MKNIILSFFLIMMTGMGAALASTSAPTSQDIKYFKKQQSHILEASKLTGINPELITAIASKESKMGRLPYNRASGAAGVMHMVPRTFSSARSKFHKQLGLSANVSVTNDRANILLATAALADNKRYLKSITNKPITDGDIYATHFLGLGGAAAVIKGDPNAPISRYVKLYRSNMSMYTQNGRVLTVSQFRKRMNNIVDVESTRYAMALNQYRLDDLMKTLTYRSNDALNRLVFNR